MRPDVLRAMIRRRPFEPIRVCLVDGSTYEIRHPDSIAIGRSTVTIAGTVAHLPKPVGDRDVIVSLLHISRLEPIEAIDSPLPSNN